jgi:flagellar biosynthesis/type III secretory pathway chaperone
MKKFEQTIEARNERLTAATIDRENAPERPLNKLIVDDQEILGQSRHLRRSITEGASNTIDLLDKKITKIRNLNPAAKARDTYLSYREDRITLKIERLRQQNTKDPISRQGKRRQRKLEMYEKKTWLEKRSIQQA